MSVEFSTTANDNVATNVVSVLNAALGSGSELHFFDGTKPALCSDADDGTLLLTLGAASPPLIYDSGGDFHADSISSGSVIADGTAQYWRWKTGGGTVVLQGFCGTGAEEIVFNNVGWVTSDSVSITLLSFLSVLSGN